jgi:hypothetical protein
MDYLPKEPGMKFIRVKLRSTFACPYGGGRDGDVVELPESNARALLTNGGAEPAAESASHEEQ